MVKRLFYDIEVSPCIGVFWGAGYKQTIAYDQIIKERAIICICYKWQGERKVSSLTWNRKQDDRVMLEKFMKVANAADELVGHNGDKFDLAWIRTRCLYHGIDVPPTFRTIDTLKVARSKFRFNSNRLDYISKFLGFDGKSATHFSWWKDILLNNCAKTLAKMVSYCIRDVRQLERVYGRIKNHLQPKGRYSPLNGLKTNCPECGSSDLKKNGREATLAGQLRQKLTCRNCGKHFKKTI